MDKNTYITGTWLGIVRRGAVVALQADTDPAIVQHLWDCMGTQPTINEILHEVTEQFGTGLAGLPSFAILLRGERLHVILRGDIDLVAHTEAGTELVSGRDVATWSERSLELPDTLELVCAESSAGDAEQAAVHERGVVLPVVEAVVRMKSLRLGVLATASQTHRFFAKTPTEAVQQFDADIAGGNAGPADNADAADSADAAGAGTAGFGASGAGALAEPVSADDFALDSDFAIAAQAADAEWNAQLAPVTGAPVESELDLTIVPDDADEFDTFEHDAADADFGAEAAAGTAHGAGFDGAEAQDVAEGPDADGIGEAAPTDAADTGTDAGANAGTETGADAADSGTSAAVVGEDGQATDHVPDPDSDDDGFTTNYDFLFGATVARSVDNAAVRLAEDGTPLPSGPVVPPLPMQPPAVGGSPSDSAATPESAPDADAGQFATSDGGTSHVPGLDSGAGADSAGSESRDPESAGSDSVGSDGLLIDSVPWAQPVQQFPVTQAPAAQAAHAVAGAPAVQTPEGDAPYDPDHDGHTVMRGEFLAAAGAVDVDHNSGSGPGGASGAATAAQLLASRPPTGPMVLARVCPNGHANPPSLPVCGRCNAAELSEPREVGRPRLGRMHISTGEVIDLDHALIVGRQPSVSRVLGEAMPRLVRVESANGDISRSHVEVRPDGWDVLLVDLKATNGTVLVREGQAPRRLGQGEEAILINGDIAELGDGVSLLFDGLL